MKARYGEAWGKNLHAAYQRLNTHTLRYVCQTELEVFWEPCPLGRGQSARGWLRELARHLSPEYDSSIADALNAKGDIHWIRAAPPNTSQGISVSLNPDAARYGRARDGVRCLLDLLALANERAEIRLQSIALQVYTRHLCRVRLTPPVAVTNAGGFLPPVWPEDAAHLWECACEKNFVHPVAKLDCPRCGAQNPTAPDARRNALEKEGLQ